MMQHDPHEPGTRCELYAKRSDEEAFLTSLNARLQGVDIPNVEGTAEVEAFPIMYIVGVPRSGTTLLSQLLSRYLPLGYINNLMARFWLRPSVGIYLSEALLGDQSRQGVTFQSTHGVSEGVCGPHEFGYFWRHWLPLDQAPTHHLDAEALAQVDRRGLAHALRHEILGAFRNGVIFKNVICGFHAQFLTSLHPKSLFVHITRDFYQTAASILDSRKERFGSYDVWWSLKPSTYPFDVPRGDAAGEVARQVQDCKREIEEQLAQPGVQAMTVSYEELCGNPSQVTQDICGKLRAMGSNHRPVSDDFPRLQVAPTPWLPEGLAIRLRECLHIGSQTTVGGS